MEELVRSEKDDRNWWELKGEAVDQHALRTEELHSSLCFDTNLATFEM